MLKDYLKYDLQHKQGLTSVKYWANKLHLSANYIGDLLKKETGKSVQENVKLRIIEADKEKLFDKDKSVSQVAYELGFEYPQYFSRMFKKRVGMTPNEYKLQN